MKKCSKCKIEKPKDQFYSHPHGKNGLSSKCKTCCAEYENNPINKARRLEKQKQRRKNNLQHRATAILSGIRRSAKQKNLEMVLTKEWIEERLRKGVCEVTGIPFVLDASKHEMTYTTALNREMNPFSPSVDRIDSSKGYKPTNCKVTVLIYNYAKSCFPEESVEMFCRAYLDKIDNE